MSKPLKSVFLLVFVLVGALSVSAQDDAVRRAINEIKRSPNYFYAESTMPSEEEATDAANVLLANFINDYVKDNGISGVDRVTSDSLEGVLYKSMKRGDNIRVFAYVHRCVYLPNYQEPEMDAAVGLDDYNDRSDVADDSSAATAPLTQAAQSADTEALTPLRRQAIDELLKKGDLVSAVKHLSKLKSENIVKRYGTMRDCRNAAASNWIIAESNPEMTVTAILGPGADSRMNYVNGSDDTLGNYSGYNAVWFEFY